MEELDHRRRLAEIVRAHEWLMEALAAMRACELPEGLIGGGAIRSVVWDYLHGHPTPTPIRDVDVAYFDPADASEARDQAVERQLRALAPGVPWEVANQAGVHHWYHLAFGGDPVPPLVSLEDAVASWPETATCVGVRLTTGGELQVVAPLGLGDLLGLVLRRNPRRVTVEEYRHRIAAKRITERWPRVTVIDG